MTNSREKFEAWYKAVAEKGWDGSTYLLYGAFKAGRESMRDEAVTKCQSAAANGAYPNEFEELIKEIKP